VHVTTVPPWRAYSPLELARRRWQHTALEIARDAELAGLPAVAEAFRRAEAAVAARPIGRNGHGELTRRKVLRLLDAGTHYRAAATECGVAPSTVRRWGRDAGVLASLTPAERSAAQREAARKRWQSRA
jgi:hypothetical protein